MTTLFRNAQVITPEGIFAGEVLVKDDRIEQVALNGTIDCAADCVVDVEGQYLSPGFIDVHTHGAGGYAFTDGPEAVYAAAKIQMQHGATTILPTITTVAPENLLKNVASFEEVDPARPGYPNLPGMHLEGPYFSHSQAGAQNPAWMRNPNPEEYEALLAVSTRILRWSFAIELPGSQEFLRRLREKGIITSLAHSDATCAEVMTSFENGLTCLTHFYSCMATVRRVNAYRVAGAIEAGYLLDDLYVEAIADGHHLPDHLLQLIYKVKGPDRVCLVTDSVAVAGLPDGDYESGGLPIIKENGVAKLPDRSAFAGSAATADQLVRTFRAWTDAPLHDIVKMASLTPATLLGMQNETGSIAPGKRADLIVFDDEINVKKVMVRGEMTV